MKQIPKPEEARRAAAVIQRYCNSRTEDNACAGCPIHDICGTEPYSLVLPCPAPEQSERVTEDVCAQAGFFRMQFGGLRVVTRMLSSGEIVAACEYGEAVERLCRFEETGPPPSYGARPWERYTFRQPSGAATARRGCELVLGRLYGYEHERG